jgi:hypothetical protein
MEARSRTDHVAAPVVSLRKLKAASAGINDGVGLWVVRIRIAGRSGRFFGISRSNNNDSFGRIRSGLLSSGHPSLRL